jgi:hypothetical protein
MGFTVAALTPAPAYAAGPISAADRTFLATVHSSVSSAASASELAQTKGAAAIRTIGKKILEQDRALGSLTRTTASRLQSPLPTTSASSLERLKTATGDAFDAGYIGGLRAADGDLLMLAATIRVNTRNDLVRDLAQRTTTAMAAQLPLLESSGLVDWAALPTATGPAPSPTVAARSGPNADPSLLADARRRDGFLWPGVRANLTVLAAATLAAAIAMWRVRRGRHPRPPR